MCVHSILEFSSSSKCDHKILARSNPSSESLEHTSWNWIAYLSSGITNKPCSQQTDAYDAHNANNQQDDSVMDNIIISCTVGDEEALVDKASSCTGSRRRLVRYQMPVSTTMDSAQTTTKLGKF